MIKAQSFTRILAAVLAAALPLVGLVSLLLRKELDPHFENYRAHFVVFGFVGGVAFILGYAAGEAANRRGDARVLLLSLAFMATGGFLGLHALGTAQVLFTKEYAGFMVAIPVGLLVSAVFAAASAFVDVRPGFAAALIRRRSLLRAAVLVSMAGWFAWTVAELPPLRAPSGEAATDTFVLVLAAVGAAIYAVTAARYWLIFRQRRNLLPAAISACFLLLAEALIGVAVTGERKWHASWWEWHGLIVTAYLIIGLRRSGMARRAVPAPLSADDARASPGRQRPLRRPRRLHRLRGALDADGGRDRARRLLGVAAPLLTRRSAARWRSSSATGSSRSSTDAATSRTTPCARRARRSRCRTGSKPRRTASGLAAHARRREQRRAVVREIGGDGPRRISARRRHGQHRRAGSRVSLPPAAS
jgi:hypothetical protein